MSSESGEIRDESAWLRLASAMAEATGKFVHFGVRPNGSWFATCDDIEYDGRDAEEAVVTVLGQLRRRTGNARETHTQAARTAEVVYEALCHAPVAVGWTPRPEPDDDGGASGGDA